TDTATVVPLRSDLVMNKVVDNGTPNVGDNVVFTLTVTNNGPSDATGVSVTDNLPNGYTYVSDDGGGAYTNGTGVWTIGNLNNGATATLNITATVLVAGNYVNSATVTGNEPDPNPGDEADTATTTPVNTGGADLIMSKTVNNTSPNRGSEVVFFLTVINEGPENATGVIVMDVLPNGYAYVSDDGAGAYNSNTGEWNVGDLNVGDQVILGITAMVNDSGDYINIASVSADQNDPNPSDNTDRANTIPVTALISDLGIVKSVNDTSPDIGDDVIFTLTVTNNGPDDATGVIVTDLLPDGYIYVSDDSGGDYDVNSGIWDIGSIANQSTAILNITVTVNDSGDYLNIAEVVSDQLDNDINNNTSLAAVIPNEPTVDNVVPEKGVSPNNDGTNDSWIIQGIENYPDNKVKLFNRWGNLIWEIDQYNNIDRVWQGIANEGLFISESSTTPVPDGTYFYVIDLGNGGKPLSGFIVIKR
ncbi:gliding motility-associated C-terminal domain-containing protein, partial [Leptobacterium sp. I13]|uniref:T9SS type B sorting domain-containing protein n=1 Tax=Leptobacterium meishanense TaxID=3128904 RepID=UPI0030EE1AE1